MRPIFLLLSALLLAHSGAIAQSQDSIYKIDEIVLVFKLAKKGMPFPKKGILPFAFKPGASVAEIKAGMGAMEVFKEDSGYVTYTMYFSKDKYDFCDITFDFAEGKVTAVSIETYFRDKENIRKGMNLLKRHFDRLYKPGEYFDDTLKWKYAKQGVNLLWIEMSQVEYEDDNGFVLDFYTTEPKD